MLFQTALGQRFLEGYTRDTLEYRSVKGESERLCIGLESINMVGKSETCNKYQSKQARDPMMIPDFATAPWEKIGTDLIHCNGKDYLLIVDYHSNFL